MAIGFPSWQSHHDLARSSDCHTSETHLLNGPSMRTSAMVHRLDDVLADSANMNQNTATLRAASLPAAPCSFDGPVSQPRRTLDPASHAVVLCLLSTVNNKALVPTSSHPCLNAASLRAPVQAALSGKFYESRHIRPPGSLDGFLQSCTR